MFIQRRWHADWKLLEILRSHLHCNSEPTSELDLIDHKKGVCIHNLPP